MGKIGKIVETPDGTVTWEGAEMTVEELTLVKDMLQLTWGTKGRAHAENLVKCSNTSCGAEFCSSCQTKCPSCKGLHYQYKPYKPLPTITTKDEAMTPDRSAELKSQMGDA